MVRPARVTNSAVRREDSVITLPAREALPCSPRVMEPQETKTISKAAHKKQSGLSTYPDLPGDREEKMKSNSPSPLLDVRRIAMTRGPFCNYKKFENMTREDEKCLTSRSIITSGPYASVFDQEILERMVSET
jgi:hypothetical protein